MNPSTPYNPFKAAAQAAIAELTSQQAQQFYALKAQEDFLTVLNGALTILSWVMQLSAMVYHLGTLSRAWCDTLVANSQRQSVTSSLVLAPRATPLALLPEAPSKVIRLPGSLASSGEVLITPAPADWKAPRIDRQLAGAESVPSQSAGSSRQLRSTVRKPPRR